MKVVRAVAAVSLFVASIGVAALPAVAAPANDTYSGRELLTEPLPITVLADTSEATTDADDADLNMMCGALATDASVWFEYTPSVEGELVIDPLASDYSVGTIVATGGPGSWTVDSCGPEVLPFYAMSGVTYTLLVFDDQDDEGGNGGQLAFTIDQAGPPPPQPQLGTIRSNLGGYDSVATQGWAIGSFLTLTVDYPTTPDSPDLTISSIEVVEDSLQIDLGSANLPGHEVSLTDGTTVVDHVVGPLQITSADRATDVVTGIATPGIPVELIPTVGGEDFLGVYYTDPETDGSWQIQVPAGTLAAANWLMSNQFETADPNEDSVTQYDWYFSEPSMSVTANGDRVEGFDWPEGADVTLTIDDPDTAMSPDFTASETVGNDPAGSNGNVGFVFGDEFDVQPGHLATLDDGQTVVSHVVQTVEVTDVDAAADTVSGTADVGDEIRVFADSGNGSWDVRVETQPGGTWVASFAGILDLVPGIGGGAIEGDPDPAVPAVTIFGWDVQEQAYVFSGFAEPVDTGAINVARAGRTVPLKFRVTTGAGDPVTDIADVAVTVTTLECELGTTEDQVEEYAAGNSGLQNLGDGYYQYNWKTPTSYRNSCKLLTLDIGDGVPHTAAFHFTR